MTRDENDHSVDPELVETYRRTRLTIAEWIIWQVTRPRMLVLYAVALLILVILVNVVW